MISPENEKHWGRMNYLSIDVHRNFHLEDLFCDEEGNPNLDLPASKGSIVFTSTSTGTRVDFKMNYSTEEQVHKLIEMGFEQGITTCLEQLNQLIIHHKI